MVFFRKVADALSNFSTPCLNNFIGGILVAYSRSWQENHRWDFIQRNPQSNNSGHEALFSTRTFNTIAIAIGTKFQNAAEDKQPGTGVPAVLRLISSASFRKQAFLSSKTSCSKQCAKNLHLLECSVRRSIDITNFSSEMHFFGSSTGLTKPWSTNASMLCGVSTRTRH